MSHADAPPKRGRGRPKGIPCRMKGQPHSANPKNRKEARSAIPVVRRLVEIVDATNTPIHRLVAPVGIHRRTYETWKFGYRNPSLGDMEALANSLGYTLTLVPLEEPVSGM